jgi:hypothetical protein
MKKNSLLILALLAVLASNSGAAVIPTETIVLPPYVVAAARFAPAEQKVNASLNQMRSEAKTPVFSTHELIMRTTPGVQENSMVRLSRGNPANRPAKS